MKLIYELYDINSQVLDRNSNVKAKIFAALVYELVSETVNVKVS